MLRRFLLPGLAALALALGLALAQAQPNRGEIAVYSARHYDTDRRLYDAFTRETGIRIRLIEGDADQLIERIRNEGANSPADVLITVDAARLARAKEAGVTQPHGSAAVQSRIPAGLQDPQGHWFAVSQRARVIMFDRQAGPPAGLARYEDLADPRFRGQICVRAANHPYNVSLGASILAADGPAATEAWARGVAQNLARPPQGGDRDQFRAIPPGQCRIAISNTYYLAAFGASENAADRELFNRIGVIFPNQGAGDRGAHVNVSGAALVRTAPNRENALRFLDYLTTPQAQEILALGNMEYPVVEGVALHPALAAMGSFRAEPINGDRLAANAAEALRILQRAGWR
ncbi:extracellular solute-binding protein [Falsiroseomonas oryziterrae]|uniref:extracellular solute-binding protein n=1 Tax=Falsiroseomonas oryziterrae TaxID=2911368 RepID=UPI001F3CDFC2|nr:extracellular solute-binding protein [Roseomonas sp. NPKOSM-4]